MKLEIPKSLRLREEAICAALRQASDSFAFDEASALIAGLLVIRLIEDMLVIEP